MAKTDLTAQRLRELLYYDPDTGDFTWRIAAAKRVRIGDTAGSNFKRGYRRISIDNHQHLSHRLAWLYVHGRMPSNIIDHINGVTNDNRIANLREVTTSGNQQNQRNCRSDSPTGLLGVSPRSKRWYSQISINGKKFHLGMFDTPDAAHQAYLAAKRTMHPTCSI